VFVKISLENVNPKNKREEILRKLLHLKTPQREAGRESGEKSFLQEIFEEFPEIDPNSQNPLLSACARGNLDLVSSN